MSEHTKGELEVGVTGFSCGCCNLYIGDTLVVTVRVEGRNLEEAKSRVDKIVRSWNRDDAFDDLLAACEAAMQIESLWMPPDEDYDPNRDEEFAALATMRNTFRAVITKATPRPAETP